MSTSTRPYFIGLFLLNIGFIFLLNFSQDSHSTHHHSTFLHTQANFFNGTYYFDDPTAAYNLLSQLDVFEVIDGNAVAGAKYDTPSMGFKPDFDYCDKHRAYFVENPDLVFKNLNFVTNYASGHKFMRQVLPMIGKDVTPRFSKSQEAFYDMPLDTNIYFIFNLWFSRRQIGKQFSCLSQASNHIAGHEDLYRKDLSSAALVRYAKAQEAKPQCFSFDKYFPKTWVLRDKDQCEDFFAEFLSPKYKQMKKERGMVYFRKIGANVHEGKGVFPVNENEELNIQNLYKNGSACRTVRDNNLIQYYVYNPLLVMNRKFGFRCFMLIASTNPIIAYYHDGYARLTLNTYDTKSNDSSTFVTNIGVNLQNSEFKDWTSKQIQDFTYWPMEKFAGHLYETGVVSDPEWLNNYLRKEFMKVKIHLIRMSHKGFARKSSLFELYGLDYVMDENLNLWYIETNTMPLVDGFTAHSTQLFNQMLIDTFDIVQNLAKSRMKRVVLYINELLRQYEDGAVPNIEARREEFRKLTMNRFEPEFMPRENNTFYQIMDENLQGKDMYMGLIDQECLTF